MVLVPVRTATNQTRCQGSVLLRQNIADPRRIMSTAMVRHPQSLISAVQRAKREHQLTDLLTLTLEAHLLFGNRLLNESRLPNASTIETDKEILTRGGRRIDLELIALDARGERLARLWSENKAGARYQPEQLSDYATDMPDLPERRQLIGRSGAVRR